MNRDEALSRLQAIQGEIEESNENEEDDPESALTVIRGMADPDEPFLPF